ncbi:hypothetical protein H7K33_15910 [Mycobacterium paraense]|uniref:hypothetical protein n=1 Tax=Mycobacterium paraense TaxID=767916 RepID=UPI000A16A0CE|nr:hypothetical protein [Mycobacterium paraense]MCV7443723.1 hypothetical protein [Mycobacterium paraense]ORW47482.1 hypothetical protein AWB89_10155 [Mycobacterium paraense]
MSGLRTAWKSPVLGRRRGRAADPERTPLYETVILGGGPAGTGPLVWAARHGRLDAWLDGGVALVEQAEELGGSLGQYPLNADSRGTSFLECLDGPDCAPFLADLKTDPVAAELESFRTGHPTLELVGRFERCLGAAILAEFGRHPNSRALTGTRAQAIRLQDDGSVTVVTDATDGRRVVVRAASAVVALGGRPNASWSETELAPGVHLGHWRDKIVSSHRLLSRGGVQEVARRLARAPGSPRVVILGGAHSAFSAAWLLLERVSAHGFGPHGIQILHRSEPRPTYPSRAAAHVDYYEFSESDVCAATGRVHRMGGLQGDGREVWRRLHRKPGTERDDRVVALPIGGLPRADLLRLLTDCDLIVPALGYRLATLPIYDARGARVPLARCGPAVTPDARLLAEDGTPVPGVFGVGLGSGFLPRGAMAGEESFTGQQNSLWLYQNGLGQLIYDATRRRARRLADVSAAVNSAPREDRESDALSVV